jgi:hypothetical protein
MIIDIIIANAVPSEYQEWALIKACYDGTCASLDHFEGDKLEDIRQDASDTILDEILLEYGEDFDVAVDDLMVDICNNSDYGYEKCEERRNAWLSMIAMNPNKTCEAPEHDEFEEYNNVSQFH